MTSSTQPPTGPTAGPAHNRTLVHDLTEHAWSQIDPVLRRVIGLSDTPQTAMQVAFLILGKVAGACGGVTAASLGMSNDEESMRKSTLIPLNIVREVLVSGPDAVLLALDRERR